MRRVRVAVGQEETLSDYLEEGRRDLPGERGEQVAILLAPSLSREGDHTQEPTVPEARYVQSPGHGETLAG